MSEIKGVWLCGLGCIWGVWEYCKWAFRDKFVKVNWWWCCPLHLVAVEVCITIVYKVNMLCNFWMSVKDLFICWFCREILMIALYVLCCCRKMAFRSPSKIPRVEGEEFVLLRDQFCLLAVSIMHFIFCK